jgi:hypothetical protein
MPKLVPLQMLIQLLCYIEVEISGHVNIVSMHKVSSSRSWYYDLFLQNEK